MVWQCEQVCERVWVFVLACIWTCRLDRKYKVNYVLSSVFFFSFFVNVFVGKVAVKKEDLQKYHSKDTWFQLQPVSADSEVQVRTERKYTHILAITHFHKNHKALSLDLFFSRRIFSCLFFSFSTETTLHLLGRILSVQAFNVSFWY